MKKQHTLYCRVSLEIKSQVSKAARKRGEKESVIVREALRQYLDRQVGFTETAATASTYPARGTETSSLNESR